MDPFQTDIETSYEPIKVTDWLITLLITSIPVINMLVLLIWAFGKNVHPSKANWAKATLIIFLIFAVLSIVIFGALFGGLFTLLQQMSEVEMGT